MKFGIETETLEFKQSTAELDAAMNSISAILNKHQAGELYFGIKPNGEVVGQIVTDQTLRDISQKIANLIEPRIFPIITKVVIDGKDCVFACHKEGCTMCSLYDGPEPISCRLYPIREVRVGKRVGLEYHRWDICHPAQLKGRKQTIRLYQFLREPLIKRFGLSWYNELCLTAEEWFKQYRALL